MLKHAVDKTDGLQWTVIASHLPGRTGKQCRERWVNHVCPEVKKGDWTEEEDRIIADAVTELGTKWSEIVKRLPGRSDNAIKNRFYCSRRKQERSERRAEAKQIAELEREKEKEEKKLTGEDEAEGVEMGMIEWKEEEDGEKGGGRDLDLRAKGGKGKVNLNDGKNKGTSATSRKRIGHASMLKEANEIEARQIESFLAELSSDAPIQTLLATPSRNAMSHFSEFDSAGFGDSDSTEDTSHLQLPASSLLGQPARGATAALNSAAAVDDSSNDKAAPKRSSEVQGSEGWQALLALLRARDAESLLAASTRLWSCTKKEEVPVFAPDRLAEMLQAERRPQGQGGAYAMQGSPQTPSSKGTRIESEPSDTKRQRTDGSCTAIVPSNIESESALDDYALLNEVPDLGSPDAYDSGKEHHLALPEGSRQLSQLELKIDTESANRERDGVETGGSSETYTEQPSAEPPAGYEEVAGLLSPILARKLGVSPATVWSFLQFDDDVDIDLASPTVAMSIEGA